MGSQRGTAAVLAALAMAFLAGVAALAVDVGALALEKSALQVAADLAALAGAQQLPEDPGGAQAAATRYLMENGVAPGEILAVTVGNGGRDLQVRAARQVPLYFARALGFAAARLEVAATARALPVAAVPRLVPWGIEGGQPLAFGREYALKWGRPQPESRCCRGNYQILDLTGTMTVEQYTDWVADDYKGSTFRVSQRLTTRTGTLGSHTERGIERRRQRAAGYNCSLPEPDPDCPLIVIAAMVQSFVDLSGRGQVQVLGFARFLITRTEPDTSGNVTVYGVYLSRLEVFAVSPAAGEFGMKGVVLVR